VYAFLSIGVAKQGILVKKPFSIILARLLTQANYDTPGKKKIGKTISMSEHRPATETQRKPPDTTIPDSFAIRNKNF